MNINKKIYKNIDNSILLSTIIITLIGIITISSATNAFKGGSPKNLIMQILWFVFSCIIAFIAINIDYNTIGNYYNIIYLVSNLFLVLVLIIGKGDDKGSKSWIRYGPVGFQPSELAKIATIIAIAKILEEMDDINTWKNLLKILIYAAIPMALIQKQPDTGSNLIFAVIICGMVYTAGIDWKLILGTIVVAALGAVGIWESGKLKNYQKFRIMVFFNPELDKLYHGYNAYYAKTAIASGKFFGRGLYQGDLTSGKFIPECNTDFIFSVFAEEWGLIGSTILLALYFNIAYRSIKIARNAKDKFGKYLVVGIITMIIFQVLQNVGMDIGLMPITGIPLPFMSYGGTSLLTNIISMALIINVGMRKKKINF